MSKDNRDMNEKEIEQKFIRAYGHELVLNDEMVESFRKGYRLAQKELEEQIKEARKVIDFYANQWEQDQSIYGGYGIYMTSLKNDTEEISKNTRSYGKKARPYLEKWK